MAKKKATKNEWIQEEILTKLEQFGIDDMMEGDEYNELVKTLCDSVNNVVKKLNIKN